MQTRTGTGRGSGAGGAFTLVELLLSITLLLLLISALVFNFAGMQRGAGLQEGETQVEALLRFARGYAATSGRLVQIRLTNEVTEGTNLVFSMVSEIDSIHNPGYFEPVFEAAPYLDQIATLVMMGIVFTDNQKPQAAKSFSLFAQLACGSNHALYRRLCRSPLPLNTVPCSMPPRRVTMLIQLSTSLPSRPSTERSKPSLNQRATASSK